MLADFFKKQTRAFYFAMGAFVLATIGMFIYYVNATGNYYNDLNQSVMRNCIISLVLMAGFVAVLNVKAPRIVGDIVLMGTVVFLGMAITVSIGTRVESMGWILFSDLESGNPIAQAALRQFFLSWAFLLIALAAVVAAGFLKREKAE
jgi:hypothetical protein